MEKTNKTRITKAMKFEDIKALLNNETPKYGMTVETAMEFINHEMDLLARKNSGEDKKMTKTQQENEVYKDLIMEYLATHSDVTCSTVLKGIPELADFSNQKVAALLRALKNEMKVNARMEKGKTLFSLA